MDVINRCCVDYSYKLSVTSPMVAKTVLSNITSTQIIRERLKIKKYVNRESASSFDILVYTIIILNISSELTENLCFKDYIYKGTKFIENSVTINDIKKRGLNPEKGFYIGNLKKNDTIKITFKVLILASYLSRDIKNKAYVEYDYKYNIEKPPIRIYKESNNVITKHDQNLFIQVIVGNTVKTCTRIDRIINIKCSAEVINTKIINCYTLNFCKVLVLGRLIYKVLYWSYGKVKCLEEVFGFSEFIVVPIGALYLENINMKIKIEYTVSKLINTKTMYINSVMLIYC